MTASFADPDWGDLLACAQQGDEAAYRRFLRAIVPFVRSLARRRTRSDSLSEDVAQDALLTVHRIRHSYQPGRPVRPWLAAIVQRRALDALRRAGRIAARETRDEAAYRSFPDEREAEEGKAGPGRELAQLRDTLSPGQREAIELLKIRELSLAEAAAASGQSIASLKVNVHRAIKRMRAALGTVERT